MNAPVAAPHPPITDARKLELLHQLERKLLWLASWTIHNANHIRPNRDGLKVGGHQASCASCISILAALYFEVARPQDRIAVKPHAGPVFHAINHLFGRQSIEKMAGLRALGGAQSYPSRVKDGPEVDFSTGSVGLGVALTSFAALMADYVRLHGLGRTDIPPGRHIAIAGDAELDEGNIYEALLEGWKHDVRNVWWIIDYNRQSLDSVVPDRLFGRIEGLFRDMGWDVVTLKYGRKLQAAFAREGGEALRLWIDDCPNSLYSALTFQGGAAWRTALLAELGRDAGVRAIIDPLDDDELAALMTNLGGHDIETVIEALRARRRGLRPAHVFHCLHDQGHGPALRRAQGQPRGPHDQASRWSCSAPRCASGPATNGTRSRGWTPRRPNCAPSSSPCRSPPRSRPEGRLLSDPPVHVPPPCPPPALGTEDEHASRLRRHAGRDRPRPGRAARPGRRIVTTSPDVTVSTSLGPWVNRRGVFDRHTRNDVFRDAKLASAQRWGMTPEGQHIELGIAEQNLFLLLGAAGLSERLYGARLLPVGTVYDPFVNRGLDALIYACYQDARFLLVSTPSGITLAPEGGQHQSVNTPLIGIAQDRLASYEPAHVDELAILLRHAFWFMQQPEGTAVWLRLSTRQLAQPARPLDAAAVIAGAHWVVPPAEGAALALAYQGPVAPEAEAAFAELRDEVPDAGLLCITSPDRLHAGWLDATRARRAGDRDATAPTSSASSPRSRRGRRSSRCWTATRRRIRGSAPCAASVWCRSVPTRFGQSGDLPDLYAAYGLDTETILEACAQALLEG